MCTITKVWEALDPVALYEMCLKTTSVVVAFKKCD